VKITINTGKSIEHTAGRELHPVSAVILAKNIFNRAIKNNRNLVYFSNSTDFISTMSALADINHIPITFYIDGIKGDMEDVFEDFNKSIDLVSEILQNKIL
jgi:hypothetical protein